MRHAATYSFKNESSNLMVASKVRLADTYFKRLFGLLFSAPLEPNEGLWLHSCKAIHTVGMRFPIDVAFLNREGKVILVIEDLKPMSLSPWRFNAYHCLELRSGQLAASHTKDGDLISWTANADH
jgi:hypothetical protein